MAYQQGSIYLHEGTWFLKYRTPEFKDGTSRIVHKTVTLCTKNGQRHHPLCKHTGEHYSEKSVSAVRDKIIQSVNGEQHKAVIQNMRVVDFWEQTYLPFAKENLRFATVKGYEQIWNQHLRAHFADKTLSEYRTHIGSQFLSSLIKTQGRRTLAHIRSLASGIFSHAVNLGFLESNPWHDVKILGKVKAPEKTLHYSLEEAENIISALVDRVDCQLVMALSFFLGLRPGEIQGLRWEDFDADYVHIRRAVVRGIPGETKTPESVASLPLIAPVLIPLNLWRSKCGNPSEGWVFENKLGKPSDLRELVRRVIVPALEAKGIEWKSLYAGRRGAGTILTELTGDALAAQQILRHKNLAVTTGFYVKAIPEAGLRGMRLLEATANGKEPKS